MKSAVAVCPDTPPIVLSRLADNMKVIRPRIASLVLFTIATAN
jgi:hypothetical protein